MSTRESLITYIADTWMNGESEGLDADVPLTEMNIIDSASIFDLVHHLQSDFRVAVPLQEVTPQNFRTVNDIAALVERLRETGEVHR